jgi:PPOX class probable F420-dependent enzyme
MTSSDASPNASSYMGHGTKQRDLIKMSPAEVDAFLAEKHTATMCTLNRDGSIHAVGMWYGFLEGAVAMESKTKAQKVLNLRRDPRITCLIETGDTYDQLRGVSLVGTAEIVEDRERLWTVGVSVFERYSGDGPGTYTDDMAPFVEALIHKRVAIKVIPKKVVTWDHRKLGLPPTG